MSNGNGNKTLTVVLTIIGLLIVAFTAMNAFGIFQGEIRQKVQTNANEILGVKEGIKEYIVPELKLNSRHRMEDTIDTQYMKQRFDRLEATQHQILQKIEQR